MEKSKESQPDVESDVKKPDLKIEGELSLEELTKVTGGTFAGPIYNGTYYPRFKSRFGSA